jgi:type IV pilus assembly protein PilE
VEKKINGFSLIELMVVVAIIAFLAGIMLPRYTKYFSKAKQAEVVMLLASLHTAQQLYWTEHGTYSTNLAQKVEWKPSNSEYTYGFYFPGAKEGINYFIGKTKTPPKKLGICHANKETFIARAASDSDTWSIDESRTIKHEDNPPS